MKQINLAVFALATTILGLKLPNGSTPDALGSPQLAPREGLNSNYNVNDHQICLPSSKNGRSNGISTKFFWDLADACKEAIYSNSPQDRTDDAGAQAVAFRHDSPEEGWAARFEYQPTDGMYSSCWLAKIKCSDFVGKNADGVQGDIATNIATCSDRNKNGPKQDAYYHGGERPFVVSAGLNMECGTTKVWRCNPGECGPEFDEKNDPKKNAEGPK